MTSLRLVECQVSAKLTQRLPECKAGVQVACIECLFLSVQKRPDTKLLMMATKDQQPWFRFRL